MTSYKTLKVKTHFNGGLLYREQTIVECRGVDERNHHVYENDVTILVSAGWTWEQKSRDAGQRKSLDIIMCASLRGPSVPVWRLHVHICSSLCALPQLLTVYMCLCTSQSSVYLSVGLCLTVKFRNTKGQRQTDKQNRRTFICYFDQEAILHSYAGRSSTVYSKVR